MKTSLIVGANGQDGKLLTELLLRRGHRIVGISRSQTWSVPPENWEAVDILRPESVSALLQRLQPDECYYLPAFYGSAEDTSLTPGNMLYFEHSYAVHVRGLIVFLHAIAISSSQTRLFYAASSHVFGTPWTQPQDESTPFRPESIYGITKATGIYTCRYYRRELDIFASTGILFNHESYLRPAKYVSSKIVYGVRAFQKDRSQRFELGDLNAVVDWGFAGDFVEAMTRILAHDTAEDFVVATGEAHTVGEFLQITCEIAGVDWRECVSVNPSLLKNKTSNLVGNSEKLRLLTGWQPTVTFREMIEKLWLHARDNQR